MPDPSGYDLQVAREAMSLAAIAYADEGSESSIQDAIGDLLAGAAELGKNYTLAWLGVSPDGGNLLYVARDSRAPARYAVVARGTDWNFLADWVDDFDVLSSQPWPAAGPDAYVATGAWDGLQSLLAMASSDTTLAAFLGSIAATAGPAGRVELLVTGHSLGGALATILGLWLHDGNATWNAAGTQVSLASYTFASPTIGNQACAAYYDDLSQLETPGWRAYRVFNEQDVVPNAYASIRHIADTGIPLDLALATEISVAGLVIDHELNRRQKAYVQASNAVGLCNLSLQGSPPATFPAEDWRDFADWVGYEHAPNTYLTLLGAPTLDVPERAQDVRSVAKVGAVLAQTKGNSA